MQYRSRLSSLTSRVANVALGLAVTATAAISASPASAQTFPFPSSNAQTGNGRFTTTVLTRQEIQDLYNRWKANFIGTCPNNQLRVVYPENTGPANDTRSEGIGYGMLISAYMGDQATFAGLRNYYFAHRDGAGLMNWKYNDCNALGNNGQGSAADADVDAAMGLIVANRQFPGQNYGADAATLLGAIRGALLPNGSGCPGILLAGTTFANCGCVNPSYIPVGYYPAFNGADANPIWATARTNSYTYFANISDNATGLVPAWSQASGALNINCNPEVAGGGSSREYQADAARTPWRVATDYLWTGDPRGATFLQDIADFAKGRPRIVHIVDRYQLDGVPLPGFMQGNNPLNANTLDATERRASFVMGGFAAAMMASSQADLDRFTGAWQSMYLPGDNVGQPRAFGSSLAILYGLLVTGFMWDPARNAVPVPAIPATAVVTGNLVRNGDFDEGILGWSTGNFPSPPDSEGFAMHQNGEVHLLIQKNNPEQPYNLQFFQPVSVQANQKYLLSLRARSTASRQVRLVVAQVNAPYTTYGELVNRASETEPLALTPTLTTYETVFQSAAADGQARLSIQFGDSDAEVVIDDVVLTPTDLPVTIPGELSGVAPPPDGAPSGETPPGGTPPGGTPPGGQGTTTPGGNLGTVNPGQGDVGSNPNGGGTVGGPGIDGALPAPPSGGLTGNSGTCTSDANCAGAKCSQQLHLCYDEATGYVWDSTKNNGTGAWTLPPRYFDQNGDGLNDDDCGVNYVFWPKLNGCYDPVSGYGWDPSSSSWKPIGEQFQAGNWGGDGAAVDSGCSVSEGAAGGQGQLGLLAGALGAALALGSRRRSRSQR